jgi:hypothetical protein
MAARGRNPLSWLSKHEIQTPLSLAPEAFFFHPRPAPTAHISIRVAPAEENGNSQHNEREKKSFIDLCRPSGAEDGRANVKYWLKMKREPVGVGRSAQPGECEHRSMCAVRSDQRRESDDCFALFVCSLPQHTLKIILFHFRSVQRSKCVGGGRWWKTRLRYFLKH